MKCPVCDADLRYTQITQPNQGPDGLLLRCTDSECNTEIMIPIAAAIRALGAPTPTDGRTDAAHP